MSEPDTGGRRGPLLARFAILGDPPSKKNTPIPFFQGIPRHPTERRRQMKMTEYFLHLAAMARDPTQDVVAELMRVADAFRLLILPNADYERPKKGWLPQARRLYGRVGEPELGTKKRPVMLGCIFFLGAGKHPDLLGLCEAAADLLQEAGWLKNDYWIARWWEGTRREQDPANPRTEVLLWDWIPGAQEALPL